MEPLKIVEADLERIDHQNEVLTLVDAYSRDPMGNGQPLPAKVKRNLIPGLRRHPNSLIFLARENSTAIGIAVCFLGFSTFAARPLINIHDLMVLPTHRGRGIGRRLLETVERKARQLGCCKITLEVLENNHSARRIYQAAGFAPMVYQDSTGSALFLAKPLAHEHEGDAVSES
jgi:GNAT superfamily N-acetyltransferase